MQSINLSKDIISENDTIRMSITTLPDEQRQVQTINIRELKHKHPVFKIKMNDKIERFIVVFRKKCIFGNDHIIASTIIKTKEISIFNEFINNDHKNIIIYEPVQNKGKSNHSKNRKIIGSMEVDFTLNEEFISQKCNVYALSQIDPIMYNNTKALKDYFFQDPVLN